MQKLSLYLSGAPIHKSLCTNHCENEGVELNVMICSTYRWLYDDDVMMMTQMSGCVEPLARPLERNIIIAQEIIGAMTFLQVGSTYFGIGMEFTCYITKG